MPVYNGVDCFTKANLRNAMDVHQSKCSGLSLFSRGSQSSTLEVYAMCYAIAHFLHV